MTPEQKVNKISEEIVKLKLDTAGYFASVEGEHIYIGSENQDDGTSYPLATDVEDMLAAIRKLPNYLD